MQNLVMELKRRVKEESPISTHKFPCPSCGDKGIVDFIDLVRGISQVHCRSCSELWVNETEASMSHLIS